MTADAKSPEFPEPTPADRVSRPPGWLTIGVIAGLAAFCAWQPMTALAIAAFVLTVLVLVVAHEAGHLLVARRVGAQVVEFGIGFPPRLYVRRVGDLWVSLNMLPFGGFVALRGELVPDGRGSYALLSVYRRMAISIAGPLVNIVIGLVILVGIEMMPIHTTAGPLRLIDVTPGMRAEMAGLAAGDVMLSVNGVAITDSRGGMAAIRQSRQQAMEIEIERDASIRHVLVPASVAGESHLIGVYSEPACHSDQGDDSCVTIRQWNLNPLSSARAAFVIFGSMAGALGGALGGLVGGDGVGDVSGPVGITRVTGAVVSAASLPAFLLLVALLSINIGIVNLLPLPILDGGRVMLLAIEWARGGRRLSPRMDGLAQLASVALLVALMVIATFGDVERIISGVDPWGQSAER